MFSEAPSIYVADYKGAPQRTTRASAQLDYCQFWNERREALPLMFALMATTSVDGERFEYVTLVHRGETSLIAGAPQAFAVDIPANDVDALVDAFNDHSTVIVERAPQHAIEGDNKDLMIIPLLTIVAKK